jgi:leucyl aminopeptidase
MKLILPIFISIIANISYASVATVTHSDGSAFQLSSAELTEKATNQHERSSYCGGFVASFKGEVFNAPAPQNTGAFLNYNLNRATLVNSLMEQVSEPRLLSNIVWFSSYHSRFYLAPSGIKAMQDLAAKWASLVKHLSFAKVELIQHKGFKQPSVILTLQGVTNDVIVVGGHGDSINKDDEKMNAVSPGADDNASGISVITEVIRILGQNDYRPQNTIKFMAYAAEEVGLLGSMDISDRFDAAAVNVLGVIQFDGTNYEGGNEAMVLLKDHTNPEQNKFLGNLINTYLKVPWLYDVCGYACSDHYSWTYRGFPASFLAESRIKKENPHIHTADDTLEVSNNSANHSVNFAKLGLAYVIELDK